MQPQGSRGVLGVYSAVERFVPLAGFQRPHATSAGFRVRDLYLGVCELLEKIRAYALVPVHAAGTASGAYRAIRGAIATLDAPAVGGKSENQILRFLGSNHVHFEAVTRRLRAISRVDARRGRRRENLAAS